CNNESMRKVASLICLFALPILALYPCYLLAKHFFGPVLIAVLLGIVFYPLHAQVQSRVHLPALASLVSTFLLFYSRPYQSCFSRPRCRVNSVQSSNPCQEWAQKEA